jgi:hypothetical protein
VRCCASNKIDCAKEVVTTSYFYHAQQAQEAHDADHAAQGAQTGQGASTYVIHYTKVGNMNKRLKELAEQAGLMPMWVCVNEPTGSQIIKPIGEQTIERFAELVRADEREANAKFFDDFSKTQMVPVKDTWRMGVVAAANAVRDKK